MIDKDPNYQKVEGQNGWTSHRYVDSGVRAEDLLFWKNKAEEIKDEMGMSPMYVGWEMPDGRIVQLIPDVKIVDSLESYRNPTEVVLQTKIRKEGGKDYRPIENMFPWHKKYKLVQRIPWYVWPLRPIILWTFLISMLVMFPWWTIGIFCGLSYAIVGFETYSGRICYNGGFWRTVFGVLAAPWFMLWMLIMASLGALPIL